MIVKIKWSCKSCCKEVLPVLNLHPHFEDPVRTTRLLVSRQALNYRQTRATGNVSPPFTLSQGIWHNVALRLPSGLHIVTHKVTYQYFAGCKLSSSNSTLFAFNAGNFKQMNKTIMRIHLDSVWLLRWEVCTYIHTHGIKYTPTVSFNCCWPSTAQ